MTMLRAIRSIGIRSALALALFAAAAACPAQERAALGEFTAQSDIGFVTPPGKASTASQATPTG